MEWRNIVSVTAFGCLAPLGYSRTPDPSRTPGEFVQHVNQLVGDLLEANPKNAEYQKHMPSFLGLLREAIIDTLSLRNKDAVARCGHGRTLRP